MKGGLNELALFAGSGGGILGGKLLGWNTRCAVEINPYARSVLLARQRDGQLERFPIWDDIKTFDGRPWQGYIDVVSGGFPCQDISTAGRGAGIEGARSGLWKHMARIIGEVQPSYVLVENSPVLVTKGLDVVLADLASMGFNAEWGVIGAWQAGAPHKRNRIWIVAYSKSMHRWDERKNFRDGKKRHSRTILNEDNQNTRNVANTNCERCVGRESKIGLQPTNNISTSNPQWWDIEPDVGRVADGVASRVDRLKCIGNGQVPAVVKLAWNILWDRINQRKKR